MNRTSFFNAAQVRSTIIFNGLVFQLICKFSHELLYHETSITPARYLGPHQNFSSKKFFAGYVLVLLIGPAWAHDATQHLTIEIDEGNLAHVEANIEIGSSQETIYNLLTNYQNWPQLFPNHPHINDYSARRRPCHCRHVSPCFIPSYGPSINHSNSGNKTHQDTHPSPSR